MLCALCTFLCSAYPPTNMLNKIQENTNHTSECDQYMDWQFGIVCFFVLENPMKMALQCQNMQEFDTYPELCCMICVLLYFID